MKSQSKRSLDGLTLAIGLAFFLSSGSAPVCAQGDPAMIRFDSTWIQAIEIMQVVQETHPLPPTRQEMLVKALRQLEIEEGLYPELVREMSAAKSADEQRELCIRVWNSQPRDVAVSEAPQQRFMAGLLMAVPGRVRWIPPSEARVTKQLAENRYVGIGISVIGGEQVASLGEIFYGGPAWKAKLKSGDKIVAVDGESVVGEDLAELIGKLRGPLGSEFSMTVDRQGDPITVEMTRLEVPIATVESVERTDVDRWNITFDKEEQLGYLRVKRVSGSTAAEMRTLLRQAEAQDCRGLIIDFRGCLAGDFHQTRMLADTLLSGKVLGRRKVKGQVEEVQSSTPGGWQDRPLVIIAGGSPTADMVWLVDALRQRANSKVVGWTTVTDGFLTGNHDLKTGGLLENVPEGFLLLHKSPIRLEQPHEVPTPFVFSGPQPIPGQLAMQPDVFIDAAPAQMDFEQEALKTARKVLLDLLK